jgi:hypothetical protein
MSRFKRRSLPHARNWLSVQWLISSLVGGGTVFADAPADLPFARGRLPEAVVWGEPHLQDAMAFGRSVVEHQAVAVNFLGGAVASGIDRSADAAWLEFTLVVIIESAGRLAGDRFLV